MYVCSSLCLVGWELGGGERRKGGWKGGEEGRMAKLKADAERLFSWTWELFAGSGYQEHENVKQTWKMKPPFIHSSPPRPRILHSFQKVQNVASGWFVYIMN